MKNVLVIKGADFSNCAVNVGTYVDVLNPLYEQEKGFYNAQNVVIGTTIVSSIFNARPTLGYLSYLVPLDANTKYKLKDYDFGSHGSDVLAYALVDSSGVILKYKVKESVEASNITGEDFDTSDYPTVSHILICVYDDSTNLPKLLKY